MKRCPECRRDYYDDTLLYCLDDGSALLDGPASEEDPATAILSEPRADAVELRQQTEESDGNTVLQTPVTANGPNSRGQGRGVDKRLLALPLLIALIVVGFFVYRYSGPDSREIESIAVMPFVNDSRRKAVPDGDTLCPSRRQGPGVRMARNGGRKREGDGYLYADPVLDPVRADPRFRELLRKAGFPYLIGVV